MPQPAYLRVHPTRPNWLSISFYPLDDEQGAPLLDFLSHKIPLDMRRFERSARLWWIHRDYLPLMCAWLKAHSGEAYLIDGRTWTNLHTGQTWEQLDLFDAETAGK